MNLELIKSVVALEYTILFSIIILATISSIIFELYNRKRMRICALIEKTLLRFISQRVDFIYEYIPADYIRLKYFLVPMIKIDSNIKGPFWDYLKSELIHKYFRKEIESSLISFWWEKKQNAALALSLDPDKFFEKDLIKLLNIKKDLVRFTAAKTCALFNTEASLSALLESLADEPYRTQFAFRDSLLASTLSSHIKILEILKKAEDPKIIVACLKILSLKLGLLTFDDVSPYFKSENMQLRWWSTRSLENIPSEKSINTLVEATKDDHWAIRALSAYCLGSLMAKQHKEAIKNLLFDQHYWVQFMAALVLSYLGKEGLEILESIEKSSDPKIFEVTSYVLTLPRESLEKGLQRFFPVNQDPLSIVEAFV